MANAASRIIVRLGHMPPIWRGALFLRLAAGLASLSPAASAAWPHSPYENAPVCTANGNQSLPEVLPDGAGGVFIVWMDDRFGPGADDIYAQRLDAGGAPLWGANGVRVCTASGSQYLPRIAPDGQGGVVIAWYDNRAGNLDIYAQRLGANGSPQWATNGVLACGAAGDQRDVSLIVDGASNTVMVFEDNRGANTDIYAQRLSPTGARLWGTDGVAVCTAAGNQLDPRPIADGAGGVILAWQDNRSGLGDIYAQRLNSSGTAQWAANGVALCSSAEVQSNPVIASASDGAALVAWTDTRSGGADIYAQKVRADGVVAWTFNGVRVCGAEQSQSYPTIAADGTGGAIVAWEDARNSESAIYAQRVGAAGAPLWVPDGVRLSTTAGLVFIPIAVADGAGGAIVAWRDTRYGNTDIYGQRVSGAGAPLWQADGAAICNAVGGQTDQVLASDGAGGAVIVWRDNRSTTSSGTDIYAQRIERFGRLGEPAPTIVAVGDVPLDQGGRIRVSWQASYLDADPEWAVGEYWLWRALSGALAAKALAGGAALVADWSAVLADASGPRGRPLVMDPEGDKTIYWEFVGGAPAAGDAGYAFTVPTLSDSTEAGNPLTLVRVQARAASGPAFWTSAPDSGYSVDNLAPAAPAGFSGSYAAGVSTLRWQPNAEPDFALYRLYRGATADFPPGPGSLVAALPDTGYADPAGAPHHYKLTAVDVRGNESPYAYVLTAAPTGLQDAPPLPAVLSLASPAPNPFNPRVTVRFALPAAGVARLTVHDAAGRRVRELVSGGILPAGWHTATWDGQDDRGRNAASGVYLFRLTSGSEIRTARGVLAR